MVKIMRIDAKPPSEIIRQNIHDLPQVQESTPNAADNGSTVMSNTCVPVLADRQSLAFLFASIGRAEYSGAGNDWEIEPWVAVEGIFKNAILSLPPRLVR